jgi:beta-aspartyl-peptidase (threonine type)
MAKSALDFLKTSGDPQAAANQAVTLLAQKTKGSGGLIMIDRNGRIGYARNTERMPVCLITGTGSVNLDS